MDLYAGDASFLDTAGRLLIALSFLILGFANLSPAQIRDHIARMAAEGMPFAAAAFWIGLALQFSGCFMLLADWHAALGAIFLIVFTVAATAIYHRFWTMTDAFRRKISRITLFLNAAIVGGLLLLLQNLR